MKKIALTPDQKEALIYKADIWSGWNIPGVTESSLDSVLGTMDEKVVTTIVCELIRACGTVVGYGEGRESPNESWLEEDWFWARLV